MAAHTVIVILNNYKSDRELHQPSWSSVLIRRACSAIHCIHIQGDSSRECRGLECLFTYITY